MSSFKTRNLSPFYNDNKFLAVSSENIFQIKKVPPTNFNLGKSYPKLKSISIWSDVIAQVTFYEDHLIHYLAKTVFIRLIFDDIPNEDEWSFHFYRIKDYNIKSLVIKTPDCIPLSDAVESCLELIKYFELHELIFKIYQQFGYKRTYFKNLTKSRIDEMEAIIKEGRDLKQMMMIEDDVMFE